LIPVKDENSFAGQVKQQGSPAASPASEFGGRMPKKTGTPLNKAEYRG
jgi:hypothetical protein